MDIQMRTPRTLTPEQITSLLAVLRERFEKNPGRHPDVAWADVQVRLEAVPERLWPIQGMESTGGEPDVLGGADEGGVFTFVDSAPESPEGRRNLCYDRAALESRKKFPPENSAMDMADALGIAMLTEEQYRALQRTGEYDTRTSSWIRTPDAVRGMGGALFCDRRYGMVFTYHNGADSYYGARGFRGAATV